MTKDKNGKILRLGDYVTMYESYIYPVGHDGIESPVSKGFCKLLAGVKYYVTYVDKGRIEILHEESGLINGWVADKFIKLNVLKREAPSWL